MVLELSGMWLSFAVAFAVHFVADFGFQQSEWMALGKSKNWEILLYHVLIYTGIFAIAAGFTVLKATVPGLLIIFLSHFFIDTFVKGRYGITEKIWVDQICHLAVLVPLVLVGWL